MFKTWDADKEKRFQPIHIARNPTVAIQMKKNYYLF